MSMKVVIKMTIISTEWRIHHWVVIALVGMMITTAIAGLCGCQSTPTMQPSDSDLVPRNTQLARQLNDRAVETITCGRFAEAEQLVEKALQADPVFAPAYNSQGLIHYHRGQLYEAAWSFQRASEILPFVGEPHNNLGLTLERAGQLDGAIEELQIACRIDPDNVAFAGNLARAKIKRGDDDDQVEALLTSISSSPRASPRWALWARAKLDKMNAVYPSPPWKMGSVVPSTFPSSEYVRIPAKR